MDLFFLAHTGILRGCLGPSDSSGGSDLERPSVSTNTMVPAAHRHHRPEAAASFQSSTTARSCRALALSQAGEFRCGCTARWRQCVAKITTFNISLVVHGTIAKNMDFMKDDSNPYAVPMAMGIYRRLESPLDITTSTITRRIVANHEAYHVTTMVLHQIARWKAE